MAKCVLTTFDNPYDPVEQFDAWYQFDLDHRYGTSQLLDRIAQTSDALTDEENDLEIERAIDDIIKHDPRNIFKKVIVVDK